MRNLALTSGIGDLGVAWSWGKEERNGVAGFVRHNVMAFLQGRYETLLEQARELDATLGRTPGGAGPSQTDEPSFELGEREAALRVVQGGQVDLGLPVRPAEQHIFIASGGSVNRDPEEPARCSFRAGLVKGPPSPTCDPVRGEGWLVNLTQPEYNAATIDTSTPAEAGAAGGTPFACALDFQVV